VPVDVTETNDITHDIIGSAIEVHKALGPGLLESAYRPCLALELSNRHRQVEQDVRVPLSYRGIRLDSCYRLDLLVDGRIIVELKSVEQLAPIHSVQLLTYLRLMNCPVGLLINFNVRVLKDGVKRVINSRALSSVEQTAQLPQSK
jgi:GxxExxY protein